MGIYYQFNFSILKEIFIMEKRDFHIIAETGIHARPATLLVQAASKFGSDVNLEYNGKSDRKSVV